MNSPLISVIIPVYNGEKTIEETIASLLQQTYDPWELIVINDGSSDRTLETLQNILTQHPKIRGQIFSYPQTGVSVSRNRGAAHAQGEFLAFLDADDLWTPDKLARQLEVIQTPISLQSSPLAPLSTPPPTAVAYSWTDYISESGEFLYPGSHSNYQGDVYGQLLLGNFLENGSNALIHRTAFHELGGFDESLVGGEEWDLFLRLAQQYPFVVVPQVQVFYRLGNQSSSASLDRQAAECLRVIDRAFQAAPPHFQPLKSQSLGNLYRYLTFRGLSSDLAYSHPWLLLRYFWQSLFHDPPVLLQRSQLLIVVGIKLLIALLLPPSLARQIITSRQRKSS